MAVDDSYTKILLHFDGSDGSTTFTDESGKTWTAVGNAQLDTALKKFGTAALLLDGTGDYTTTPDHTDFTVGSGNFTVDFWVQFSGSPADGWLFGLPINAGTYSGCALKTTGTSPNIHVVLYASAGSSWDISAATGTANLATGTWYHIAVVRNGSNWRVYVNGTVDIEVTSSITCADGTNVFSIGSKATSGVIGPCSIDEFRFSLGIARWTANFTPPTAPYAPLVEGDFTDGLGLADTVDAVSFSDTVADTVGLADTVDAFVLSDVLGEGVGLADTVDAVSLSGTVADGLGIADTVNAEAYTPNQLRQSLPLIICQATGDVRSGSLTQPLPLFTCSATGVQGIVGSVDRELPSIQILASGLSGQVGSFDQLLPAITISSRGYTQPIGTANLTLPMFYISASGQQALVDAEYLVLVMNTKNMAVSEYDWSGFNSFAYFNGEYLGAKSGSIHVLSGDDDAGSVIASEIKLGQIPVDSIKPRDVYVLGRATGMMALTIEADEDTEKEVKIAYMLETLNLDRAKIPRGIKPTYFSLSLENKNGSDFDIDAIQIYAERLSRGQP